MPKSIRFITLVIFLFFSFTLFAQDDGEQSFVGTLEPYAEENIYFLMTDRFVDGDSSNNYESQGGNYPTWWRELTGDGGSAYIGYQGGDFKGVYNNADYIQDMGFTSVWITPIVDNPDQNFSGGSDCNYGSGPGADKGKTGYHGYWADNFYQVDEHLPSSDLSFQQLCSKLEAEYGIKIVLDIVANHANPGFTMAQDQYNNSKFGHLYDEDWNEVASSGNQANGHPWFQGNDQLAQLLDFNPDNSEVEDYLVGAYLKWIGQGASAFRIDTIKHMPHTFWKRFSDRIRAEYPGFYMFGEAFTSDPGTLAAFQKPENGGISVLDFPCKDSMRSVFGNDDSDYSQITGYLHLDDGIYTDPYSLVTFYDNHDMARINASQRGYINAHNWLFTTRGIPCVYYGSEIGFQTGKAEHQGNRNLYGQSNVDSASGNPIYQKLKRIATIRKGSIALQKGLQINMEIAGQTAALFRTYEHEGLYQTALVLLNKGDSSTTISVGDLVNHGTWVDADNASNTVSSSDGTFSYTVGANDVKVFFFNEKSNNEDYILALEDIIIIKEKVELNPEPPVKGYPVTILYKAAKDKNIELHWGKNNWGGSGTPLGDEPMTWDAELRRYTVTIDVPSDADQIDFVFHNLTDGSWDTNGGSDWHYECYNGMRYGISGTVSDSDGNYLQDVTVTAGGKSTTTDLYGNYAINGLADNNTYSVTASKTGYSFTTGSASISGGDVSGVNLTGTKEVTYSLSGTITISGSTSGLAGVTVSAGSASCSTAADGSYTITGLINGTYTVTPSIAGYTMTPASRSATINGADAAGVDFEATVIENEGITVHFYKPSNWPNADVRCYYWATNNGESMTSWNNSPVMENEGNGWYKYEFEKATSASIVFNNSYSPQSDDLEISGAAGSHHYYKDGVWLPTGGTISGTITKDGKGVSGVTVTAGTLSAATDVNGSYSIVGVSAGTYSVTPSKSGYTFTPASKTVTVNDDTVSGVDFAAEGGGVLTIHFSEWQSATSYSIHCWEGLSGDFAMTYEGYINGKHWWVVNLQDAPANFKFCFKNSNGSWDGGNRSYTSQADEIYINAWDNNVYTTRP